MRRPGSTLLLLLVALTAPRPSASSSTPTRQIALTFDDLPGVVLPEQEAVQLAELTDKLVSAIAAQRVPAIGFVNEGRLGREGAPEPERVELLERWLAAGLELGNHTFSHIDLHRRALDAFQRDAARGEAVTRSLLAAHRMRLRFFRHPFLHTGRTLEIRHAVERSLAARGERIAPVTVDNSDWIFARAYALARASGDAAAVERIEAAYVPYVEAKVEYFERQSVALFSREIRQILLLHANALNADRFGELVSMLRRRGYAFISLDRALEDRAYRSRDDFVGPGGISWLHRWALSGGRNRMLPGEPATPRFVLDAAGISEE
jgi:peptidoglycan/xylan/chitin deacetylase (PgdA/CDA1 family)